MIRSGVDDTEPRDAGRPQPALMTAQKRGPCGVRSPEAPVSATVFPVAVGRQRAASRKLVACGHGHGLATLRIDQLRSPMRQRGVLALAVPITMAGCPIRICTFSTDVEDVVSRAVRAIFSKVL